MRRLAWVLAVTAPLSLLAAVAVALWSRADPAGVIWYIASVVTPYLAAGVFLMWRHPRHRAGPLLVIAVALTMAYAVLLEQVIWASLPDRGVRPWMSLAIATESIVSAVGLAFLALLIALFPTGVASSRVERLFARSLWLLPLPIVLALITAENVPTDGVSYAGVGPFPNPFQVAALGSLAPILVPLRYLTGAVLVVAVALLLRRYRAAPEQQRRQIRWAVYGCGAAIGVGVAPFVLSPILSADASQHPVVVRVASLALLLIPATVVISVDQPRWIDTDTVIRRSFAYAVLSLAILAGYAGLAAGLGLAAGARLPLWAAVSVTIVVAMAFQPARARLQRVADRWVFGQRPTAPEAISVFDATVREATTAAELGEQLAQTVRRAARLRWAAVCIPPQTFTAGRQAGDVVFEAPLRRGDDELGTVRCGRPLTGTFSPDDVALVTALTSQATLAMTNAGLAARIVAAQGAERRRLERNIHDGAQQDLAALATKLGLVRARLRSNGAVPDEALADLQRDVATIVADLRELAQGIHPSVLTDGGLAEAVRDRCTRLPIPVSVSVPQDWGRRRFDGEVEGAAYFIVTEALANVLKHADASSARVDLAVLDGVLELTVTDDGRGFDSRLVHRNGLAGLSDRVAALSGKVSIGSGPVGGTVLRASLPVSTGDR